MQDAVTPWVIGSRFQKLIFIYFLLFIFCSRFFGKEGGKFPRFRLWLCLGGGVWRSWLVRSFFLFFFPFLHVVLRWEEYCARTVRWQWDNAAVYHTESAVQWLEFFLCFCIQRDIYIVYTLSTWEQFIVTYHSGVNSDSPTQPLRTLFSVSKLCCSAQALLSSGTHAWCLTQMGAVVASLAPLLHSTFPSLCHSTRLYCNRHGTVLCPLPSSSWSKTRQDKTNKEKSDIGQEHPGCGYHRVSTCTVLAPARLLVWC